MNTASATQSAPAHQSSRRAIGRWFHRAASGNAKSSDRTNRGWTTSRDPTAIAAAWKT